VRLQPSHILHRRGVRGWRSRLLLTTNVLILSIDTYMQTHIQPMICMRCEAVLLLTVRYSCSYRLLHLIRKPIAGIP
jgi:hypothetical protein